MCMFLRESRMHKILYVNGCSHSCGAEITHSGSCRLSEDLRLSWAGKLSDALSMQHHNDAASGQDNLTIFSNTVHSILNLLDKHDSSNIKVVIGWTAPEREYFIYKNSLWILNPGMDNTEWFRTAPKEVKETFYNYITRIDHNDSMNKFALQYYNMVNFLKKHNIEYYFFNAISRVFEPSSNIVHSRVNNGKTTKKLFDMIRQDSNYLDPYNHDMTYFHYMSERYDSKIDGRNHHFTADAQTAWTELLLETPTMQRWQHASKN